MSVNSLELISYVNIHSLYILLSLFFCSLSAALVSFSVAVSHHVGRVLITSRLNYSPQKRFDTKYVFCIISYFNALKNNVATLFAGFVWCRCKVKRLSGVAMLTRTRRGLAHKCSRPKYPPKYFRKTKDTTPEQKVKMRFRTEKNRIFFKKYLKIGKTCGRVGMNLGGGIGRHSSVIVFRIMRKVRHYCATMQGADPCPRLYMQE